MKFTVLLTTAIAGCLMAQGALAQNTENHEAITAEDVAGLIAAYAFDALLFFDDFASSMLRMGRLAPGAGTASGEVRRNCRVVN